MNQTELDGLRIRGFSTGASALSVNRHHEAYIEVDTNQQTGVRLDPDTQVQRDAGWFLTGAASSAADALAGTGETDGSPAPDTVKRIASQSASDQVYIVGFETFTLAVGEVIEEVRLHVYCDRAAGSATGTAQLYTDTTALGSAIDTTGATAWRTQTYVPPSAQNIAVGLATETDSAFAVGEKKSKAIGLASSTESALAIGEKKVKALGLASSTESAFAITYTKSSEIGPSIETNTLQAFGEQKVKAIGLASSTETAFDATPTKAKAVGLVTETNTAQSFGEKKVKAVGLASSTDSALSITGLKAVPVGLATCTEAALSIASAKSLAVGQAEETDEAIHMTVFTDGESGTSGQLPLIQVGK